VTRRSGFSVSFQRFALDTAIVRMYAIREKASVASIFACALKAEIGG
jgi:hypothetical protein